MQLLIRTKQNWGSKTAKSTRREGLSQKLSPVILGQGIMLHGYEIILLQVTPIKNRSQINLSHLLINHCLNP